MQLSPTAKNHTIHNIQEPFIEIVTPAIFINSQQWVNTVRQLRNYLGLCIGMRVMLLDNQFQQAGLVNGACGILRDIVWKEDAAKNKPPEFVVIEFPGYTGHPFAKFLKRCYKPNTPGDRILNRVVYKFERYKIHLASHATQT